MHKPPARYTFDGKSLTLREWSQITGIHNKTLFERIHQLGWTLERALTEPIQRPRGRRPSRPLSPAHTGGYQPTSPLSSGTGPGRQPRHLQVKNVTKEEHS